MSPSSARYAYYSRHAWTIILVALVLLPWFCFNAYRAVQKRSNDLRQWLPHDLEEAEHHEWFTDLFGADESAVVSWPGCRLDDPRVEMLAAALAPHDDQFAVQEDGNGASGSSDTPDKVESFGGAVTREDEGRVYFDQVISGQRALRILTSKPYRLTREAARKRLEGFLVGPGEATCLFLVVSPHGMAHRSEAIEAIYRAAEQQCELSRDMLHLGGPTVDGATIDRESQRSLFQYAGLSAVLVMLTAWQRLKNLRLALLVLFVSLYATAMSLTWVRLSGGEMNLALVLLPTLVFVLNVSMSVHLVNYFQEAVTEYSPDSAAGYAVAHGWRPCTLSMLTTAAGFASLYTSRTGTIQWFGLYSAAGALSSLPIALLLLPASLQCFASRVASFHPQKRAAANDSRFLYRVAQLVITNRWPIIALGLLSVIVGIWGVTRLRATVKIQHRFAPTSRIIRDYAWLEQHIGPLVPLEVVVRFDRTCELETHERMDLVGRLQQLADQIEPIGASLSAVNFVPPMPRGGGLRQTVERGMIRRSVAENVPEYAKWRLVAEDNRDDSQLWRISLRVAALNDIDYGRFLERVERRLTPALEREDLPGVSLTYTGVIPLMYKAQRVILSDLLLSFTSAFAVISVVMILILRRIQGGLLAMVPNIFPFLVIFGGMGFMGITVEIGAVMTASVALGIAVDDTIHFLTWYRRRISEGGETVEAIFFGFEKCAAAVFQTSIICSVGVLPLALSSFMPTVRFARLMIALLIMALVGDLILLPAILASPLGRLLTLSGTSKRSRE